MRRRGTALHSSRSEVGEGRKGPATALEASADPFDFLLPLAGRISTHLAMGNLLLVISALGPRPGAVLPHKLVVVTIQAD
jgi:hypothetical protein